MKRKITLVSACVSALFLNNLYAQTLDVDFTGISGNCGSYIGLSETQTLGQSFTAGISGNLTSVNVGIAVDACTETNIMNCIATVYDGTCTGTVIATENFSIPTGSSLSMYPINFSNPASIASGQTYTLELSVISGQDCNLDPFSGQIDPVFGRWILENQFNCGGEYAGGTSYEPNCSPYPGDFYIQTIVSTTAQGIDTRTECNSYTWIDGITYTTSNNTATHNIIGGAANGCDSLVTLNLTINNVSDLTTSITGVTIAANNTGATYQWLDCDNNNAIIVGETGQTFSATSNGNYAVELTENGCVDTSACFAINSVGIFENDFGNHLLIYPNPTSGHFSIDLGDTYKNVEIVITDIHGKRIESKNTIQSQILSLSIDESTGIYFVSVTAGDKRAFIRLVKE